MNLSGFGGKCVYCPIFSLGANKNIFIVLERFPWNLTTCCEGRTCVSVVVVLEAPLVGSSLTTVL